MMSDKPKKKRDLLSTFQSIERYHRRRSVFVLHAVLSIALQMAMWGNWYASYARYGQGFTQNYFADRIIVSAALFLALAGHLVLMYLSESKDRLVVLALQQHDDELRSYESDIDEDESETDEPDISQLENTRRRLTK